MKLTGRSTTPIANAAAVQPESFSNLDMQVQTPTGNNYAPPA